MKVVLYVSMFALWSAMQAAYYPVPENRVFGHPQSPDHEQAVNELMSRFREAWANEDAAGVAATHAADAEWTNAFGRPFGARGP